MKLRLLLASCVIALSACATTAQNGVNANDANILQGAEVAYSLGKSLYDQGKLNDDDAEAIVTAINTVITYVKASRAAKASGDAQGEAAYLRAAADALDAVTARLASKKG
jgi:hypothetical protein